jgi:hypothetical protein
VYRYGSKKEQVLSVGAWEKEPPAVPSELMTVEAEYSGGCASGLCPF